MDLTAFSLHFGSVCLFCHVLMLLIMFEKLGKHSVMYDFYIKALGVACILSHSPLNLYMFFVFFFLFLWTIHVRQQSIYDHGLYGEDGCERTTIHWPSLELMIFSECCLKWGEMIFSFYFLFVKSHTVQIVAPHNSLFYVSLTTFILLCDFQGTRPE